MWNGSGTAVQPDIGVFGDELWYACHGCALPDPGEPNGGYVENCGVMQRQALKNPPYGFYLFDTDCEELHYPVCEGPH